MTIAKLLDTVLQLLEMCKLCCHLGASHLWEEWVDLY